MLIPSNILSALKISTSPLIPFSNSSSVQHLKSIPRARSTSLGVRRAMSALMLALVRYVSPIPMPQSGSAQRDGRGRAGCGILPVCCTTNTVPCSAPRFRLLSVRMLRSTSGVTRPPAFRSVANGKAVLRNLLGSQRGSMHDTAFISVLSNRWDCWRRTDYERRLGVSILS